jgi:RNA polymerase subunit RPABC4/transcription elongation factor Spt4
LHFNFCPVCGRWVCDDCISLNDRDGEVCRECGDK